MSAKLTASGTDIVNGSGAVVRLFGVNTDHNQYNKGYFSAEDVARMQSHGGNCLEFNGLRVQNMMPSRGNIDPAYLAKLDSYVNICENAKQYMIFTFEDMSYETWASTMPNWMIDGHGYGTTPYSETTVNQAVLDFWDVNKTIHNDNRQSFADMWAYLANRYKDKQYVMFGIMNEPFSHCDINANGGSTYSQHMGYSYATVIGQVVDAIHAVANNLIFVDRPYVWYYSHVQPINRQGIVWEDHRYVDADTPSAISDWKTAGIDSMIARFETDFGKPFYLGEYGPYPTNITGWQNIFSQQRAYLQSKLSAGELAGFSWHQWGVLYGEVYSGTASGFNQADSEILLNIVYSSISPTKKYMFMQWENGDINNSRTIQV